MGTFWRESALVTAIICWFVAQVIKVIVLLVTEKKLNFRRLVGSGGMPSSHSAFVTGLAVSLGIKCGFLSNEFSISAVLALVVMYDACGIRRAAGEQAKILNKLVAEWSNQNYKNTEVHLKELLGHTPMQVVAGACLGIGIALIRCLGV